MSAQGGEMVRQLRLQWDAATLATRWTGIGALLAARAERIGALKRGNFTLVSGERSSIYFDGRMLTLDPEGSALLGGTLLQLLRLRGIAACAGPAAGAIPIVGAITALSAAWRDPDAAAAPVRGLFTRSATKDHGTRKQVEGTLEPGLSVGVVEDTVTSGGSLLRAVEALQQQGCKVELAAAILDRGGKVAQPLSEMGIPFHPLLRLDGDGELRPQQLELPA